MMARSEFKCQMVDYDGKDDWSSVLAYDAEYAAEQYAEECDSRSGGDLFSDHSNSETIRVRDADGQEYRFAIRVEYSRDFHVSEVNG